MDFINDVALKDSKLVFKTIDSNLQEITKNAIEFDDSAKLKASFDGIEIGSEIRLVNGRSNNFANIAMTTNSCGTSQLTINVGSEIDSKLSIGSCSHFNTPNLSINTRSFDIYAATLGVCASTQFDKTVHFCSDVHTHGELIITNTLNANANVSFTGSRCGTSKFVSDIPATFNEKAIFNDGICTKTITSIAGTPIFDTTDRKGFNFKGLYTLNGFCTIDKPFFKQESATNNWIDVTTLKEDGTALADKYALKTDISNVYKYVGSVDTVSELPSNLTEADAGKVYNIVNESTSGDLSVSAGDNVAWTGSSWDKLGGSVDLSNYAEKSTTLAGYGITDAYTKSEIDLKDSAFLTKESSGIQTVSSDLALTGYVLIDNLSIDELNIESLTASSNVTLSGGLDVVGGLSADGGDFTGSIHIESRAKSIDESDFYTNERYISIDGLADPTTGGTAEHVKIYSTMHKAGVVELSDWSSKAVYSTASINITSTNPTPGSPAGTFYFPNIGNNGSDFIATASSVESKADKATTLAGYGITDAYTKTEVNNLVSVKADASSVYTKTEIDSQNTAFLTKESSGIQTVSSDLALTGYVLIDNLAIDELNIESLTATSKVTLSGGLDVTGGITVDGKDVATKDDIPDLSDIKTPIFKYFQNPVIPASCSLFAIATNEEFENMPMMQLVRNSDNKIVSADISWKSNASGGHDIMVGIDHSAQINANTYTLQAFGY